MNAHDRENQYIRKWRPFAVRGDNLTMPNVAAAYRILGKLRLAAKWYRRAAERGDGDAMTDWAYCLQHGAGVRRDEASAEQAYRSAIASESITQSSREEAMYYLAVILLGKQSTSSRRAAAKLLRVANTDGDYPQAQTLLEVVTSAAPRNVCTCRRYLRPRLAKRHCRLHGARRGRPTRSTKVGGTPSLQSGASGPAWLR